MKTKTIYEHVASKLAKTTDFNIKKYMKTQNFKISKMD